MMATYPVTAAAAAAAVGNTRLPSGTFCNLPWICPGQTHSERILQSSIARRDGRFDEMVVPGTSHPTLALHNPSVGHSPYFSLDSPSLMYSYYLGFGGSDVRRKNATRESTGTLKAWLYEHRKNPYPTKGEKIMLAIITKMTLTQVSTWFANARRRLKKENKGEWGLKETNDPDEDDFDDDVTQCDGCPADMTSASDTSSSTRESPNLPLVLYAPSAKGFPAPLGCSSADDESQNATLREKLTNDDITEHRLGFDDDVTPLLLSNASSRSLVLDDSKSFPVPVSSASVASPKTTDERLISVSGDIEEGVQLVPHALKAGVPAVTPSSTTAPAVPAKRKLWSIDDIVSTAHPSERTSPEHTNHPLGVTISVRPITCEPSMDRPAPYKYGPYPANGQRGSGGNVTSFATGNALFPWITSSTGDVIDGDVGRLMGHEKIVRSSAFNRPPHLNHTGFTLRKSPDNPTALIKTENREFK